MDAGRHIHELETQGFTIVRGAISPEEAEKIRSELEPIFEIDVKRRLEQGIETPRFDAPDGITYLFDTHQFVIEAFEKSPTLDQCIGRLLESGVTLDIVRAFAGDHFRMRGYTVRKMTGALDPPPGFTWHRDNRGELGLGVMLTDINGQNDAATGFVPGSHLYPYTPEGNCLFPMPHMKAAEYFRLDLFSRILARLTLRKAHGLTGKAGDVYIFNGETWHSRTPNLNGANTWVFLTGFFPTEFPMPEHGTIETPQAVRNRLPAGLQRVTAKDQPVNAGRDSMVHRILAKRKKVRFFSLWQLAQWEAQHEGDIHLQLQRIKAALQSPAKTAIKIFKRIASSGAGK